ncbi:MAG: ABC transporter permease [Planctomycetota bacterium]|nr:ABC transporter permease [Planctomycetota bacterium]
MSLLRLGWVWCRRRLILVCAALGIALGVAVLFTVLAVFQGFVHELETSIKVVSGDLTLQIPRRSEARAEEYLAPLRALPEVADATVRLNWFGMVGRRGARALDDPRAADLTGLMLAGVEGVEAAGLPPAAPAGEPAPVLMGKLLANRLGLVVGDALEVFSYRDSGRSKVFVRKTYVLADFVESGRYDQDLNRVLAHRADVALLAQSGPNFSEIAVHARPGTDAELLAAAVIQALANAGISERDFPAVRTWEDQGGQLLRAARDQQGLLGTVFFMIVLVAAYQLVATLLLTVTEKRREIGVLGALGASPGRVAGFFCGLATLIAGVGCAAGLGLGALLVANISSVEKFLGGGKRIFLPEIYIFTEIPIRVEFGSSAVLVAATLLCALLFSLLPAWRAARVPVVRALARR